MIKLFKYTFLPFLLFIPLHFSSSAALSLEDTKIGKAVISESITSYRKAFSQINSMSIEEAERILTATDANGNTLLHLMAQVKKNREAFAGELLKLSVILVDDFNNRDIIEEVNNRGLTPVEVAFQSENEIAKEYLITVVNAVRKQINNPSSWNQQTGQSNLKNIEVHPRLLIRYGAGGGVLVLNGLIFLAAGMLGGDPSISLVGAVEIGVGGIMCHQAFKTLRANRPLNK